MKNNNLLASVALFSELYNSETYKSIPDILAEFIKGAIVYEQKYSVNSTELKDWDQKVDVILSWIAAISEASVGW